MLKDIFNQKRDYLVKHFNPEAAINSAAQIPDNMWIKCPGCGRMIYDKVFRNNLSMCPICSFHCSLRVAERIEITFDKDSFDEFDYGLPPSDPLSFPDYPEKLRDAEQNSGLKDAVLCGIGLINGIKTAACIMDNAFMMGSMGYVVGESITRTVEYATENALPLLIFTTSGGARMQEGIISLMQMAKISGALEKHSAAGLLYISIITNPTTGGVTASFASLGDIILAETGALFGFAGKRVIEQTILQKLPKNFQTAEFALERGFIDSIVNRKKLKDTLWQLLMIHTEGGSPYE